MRLIIRGGASIYEKAQPTYHFFCVHRDNIFPPLRNKSPPI